jgi:F-type H+-transporting ATP synthase subunit e
VFYGIYHRRTLQNAHDTEKAHHVKHEREALIAQAKDAWKKKQAGDKDGGE